jgi:hypothetical protein
MFLGTAEGLQNITRWVMQRGILGQFWGARDVLYGPLIYLSIAQVMFWHFFKVLEATENSTEDALKGGGFIPWRVFLSKHVTSRSSAWAMPALVLEFIHSCKFLSAVAVL